MKYKIFKTQGNTTSSVGLNIGKHELIGIEFGADIYKATDDIMRAVTDDLSSTEEYAKCQVYAYPPEEILVGKKALNSRYTYTVSGIVSPVYAKENIVVYYAIVEEDE